MRLFKQAYSFNRIIGSALLLMLFIGTHASASYISLNVSKTVQTSFVAESERSKDPYYQYTLGVAAYEVEDYDSAAKIFTELAKIGYISAQYYLGVMLDSGVGMEADHVQSAMWYRKAAIKGHIEAQYNLGIAYATGEGVPVNMLKSIYWMKKAALGGSVNSQYNLGLIYYLGNGVKLNLEEGIFWWKLAAKNGDSVAQYNLGMIYMQGKGVDSDICEASRWWQISAQNGYTDSLTALEQLRQSNLPHNCIDMVSAR